MMVFSQIYPRLVAWILDLLHRRTKRVFIVELNGLQVQICPHVFNPLTGRTTRFFIQHMQILPSSRVLEIGTGTGAIAAAAAQAGGHVTATDINPYAVQCARTTMRLNNLQNRVSVLSGDLFEPVQNQTFDVILFNPPYFASKASSWIAQAWFAGPQCELVARFLSGAHQVLAKGGQIQILISSATVLPAILQMIRKESYDIQVVAQCRLLGLLETVYLFQLL
ncbi:MAG: methyltransferase [Candidatus Hermodarchaeota archaeon]|nr:methyltransferase [Candidatus Hermodarchaeota archaeon]